MVWNDVLLKSTSNENLMVKYYLTNGTDVNAKYDSGGKTALMLALSQRIF